MLTQPASEGHAIAVECNDVTIDLDVPADFFTKPSRYACVAVLLFRVKRPAHADRTVLIQSGNLSLTQQLIVGFGFSGRDFQLPECRLEDSVSQESKQIAEAAFAVPILVSHQASSVLDFRYFPFLYGFHVPSFCLF